MPVGFEGEAIRTPRVAAGPVPLDQRGRQLVARLGSDRQGERFALEHADEMAVARIARVSKQDLLATIDQQCHHQQQRRRRARRDDDTPRVDLHAIVVGVVTRDRLAQFGQAQRRRVVDAAVGQRPPRGVEHRLRRREIGLADLHVNDTAPRGLERAGSRLDFHHVERRDVGDACGKTGAGVHRKA